MKKTLYTILITISLLSLFTACASKQKAPKERNEHYIADVNPFIVDTFHLYTSKNIGKPTISDFTVYFAPKTNYIMLSTKIGINFIRIDFSYEERKAFLEAKDIYIESYNSGTITKEKPTKKNAYSKGNIGISWGAAGLANYVDTTYKTHAYYLEPDKPYFRISIEPAEEEGNEHVYSPSFCIYISPSQWESIIEACNQDHLVALTDEILNQANAF